MPGREEGRRDSENEQEQVCLVKAEVQEDQANKEITRTAFYG